MLVPGLITVPGFKISLDFPCSILMALTTFHLPSGNFWNDPQGAFPASANTAAGASSKDAKTIAVERTLTIAIRPSLKGQHRITAAACRRTGASSTLVAFLKRNAGASLAWTFRRDRRIQRLRAFQALGRIGHRPVDGKVVSKTFQDQRVPSWWQAEICRVGADKYHLGVISEWCYPHLVGVIADDP